MKLQDRIADLVGCTVVLTDEVHVVFWNGRRTFLRYRFEGESLTEAGSYMARRPPVDVEYARVLASAVTYL